METLTKKSNNSRIAAIPLVHGVQDMRGLGDGYENAFPSVQPLSAQELRAEAQERQSLVSAPK